MAPGKRPITSMTPTIVFDEHNVPIVVGGGKPWLPDNSFNLGSDTGNAVKSIFAKTGTNRQAQCVAVILRSVASIAHQ